MRRRPAILAAVPLLVGGATTAPATAPAPPVAAWFAQLGDPDPTVRDAAREQLMGLSVDALPVLREVVRAGPVRPAQAAALYEVVRHVLLAGEEYDADDARPDRFIMGQSWPTAVREAADRPGVPVVDRWPGFPARRAFRDGDLILGVYSDPRAPPAQPPDMPTRQVDDLVSAMRDCPTRPRLTFAVLRDGRPIRVTATMVAEPVQTFNRRAAATVAFLLDRQRRADDYWAAQFAPLVPPPTADPLDGAGP